MSEPNELNDMDDYARRAGDIDLDFPKADVVGIKAHLKVVTQSGEVRIDEDVNRVMVATTLRWQTWEPGQKAVRNDYELSLSHLASIEITPCKDRLAREPVGGS